MKVPDIFQTEIYGSPEYRHMHDQLMPFPIIIDIEPTNACNLNCLFCARQVMQRPEEVMPLRTLKTIVDEMAGANRTSVRFSGWGEPTLNPHIVDFVTYARGKNILTHLTTNATRLSGALSRELLSAGLNKIKFSFQGLTPDEYQRMRPAKGVSAGEDVYERVVANVKTFVEMRNALGAACHIQVSVSMLQTEQHDKAKLQAFYDFWHPLVDTIWGLGKIGIYGGKPLLTSFRRVQDRDRISANDLQQGRPLRRNDVHKDNRCTELYNKLSIHSDGSIKACCDDYDRHLVVGHIGQNTIQEAWDGQALANLRRALEEGDAADIPEFCMNCDNYL